MRALSSDNGALQQQIAQRRQQIGESNNTDWLQEQARHLGLVFPGETVFVITGPGKALPSSGGINAALPTYAPAPSATASPGAAVTSPGSSPAPSHPPTPAPTPLVFVMPTPTPH